MVEHLDLNDERYPDAAREILRRHDLNEPEANITAAIRDFLILTNLAKSDEIVQEQAPALGARTAVDLTALDTFVEIKRRIGTTGGFDPDPTNVGQLDGYLEESEREGGRHRMGVLTDGKHWLLRWPGAGDVKTTYPYAFTLENADGWLPLYEWLRDKALESRDDIPLDRESATEHFGPDSPRYRKDIARLKELYTRNKDSETIRVKVRLWGDLLRAALGEAVGETEDVDDLFVRHTYLSMVVGMVVQATFGIDIYELAENDPDDLLKGRKFQNDTGLQGVVESDFFAWPAEVDGGVPLLKALANRIARFDWTNAPPDIAAILYETVIPPDERRRLGEYYTPDWLARAMVRELVTDPLEQRVLDPACGSGTFIVEAVNHFMEQAGREGLAGEELFDRLHDAVTGIDVHPVAVHLARAAWTLAARPAIASSDKSSVSVPIYLGDSLQLRFRTGDMFAEHEVRIEVEDEENTALVFPVSLVERAGNFDSLMSDVADAIERGDDPLLALDDNGITDPAERGALEETIDTMRRLHSEGRNHIWAYYTRNLVRPVALSRSKVDVVIGNPPWLNYSRTISTLRTELERQSKGTYGIWTGGRYAPHQDVAGLFYTRSVDLYLRDGGVIGMVMPHSALQAGQYRKWRVGRWTTHNGLRSLSVDFGFKTAWDLEKLEPNNFFPIVSSVAFAKRTGEVGEATPLTSNVEQWLGATGTDDVRRVEKSLTNTSVIAESIYAGYSREGATIVPRCLFLVNEIESTTVIRPGQTITVNPRRGPQDKPPWKTLDLTDITNQTIETLHVHDVHVGETLVPYATLEPRKAVLPIKRTDSKFPANPDGVGGIQIAGLERRMRERWQNISKLWEENKGSDSKLSLREQIDYLHKASYQFAWKQDSGDRPIRVVYSSSGVPTAALLHDDDAVVDYTLFWVSCSDEREANYLLAIINSQTLYEAVEEFMAKGQFGARHLQKHLWKLPIPEFDSDEQLHIDISKAGQAASKGVVEQLAQLHQERENVTYRITRRELRKWLADSEEGRTVETLVGELLSQ